jgi:hypothetical protein
MCLLVEAKDLLCVLLGIVPDGKLVDFVSISGLEESEIEG